MWSFKQYALIPSILGTLDTLGFEKPTEIQQKSLPKLLNGDSIVGIAETGSGKTLAYILPVLHALKQLEEAGDSVSAAGKPRALVMVPSSDLGEQVAKVFKTFTHETRLRVRTMLGGQAKAIVRKNGSAPFEILIATPGRLEQLMDLKLISLSDLRMLVVDEADLLLDRGFLPSLKRVLRASPDDCQLALFSATASAEVRAVIRDLFGHAKVIETRGRHKLVPTLKTINMDVEDGIRFPFLQKILAKKVAGGTLVFANSREQCDSIYTQLTETGCTACLYRGDMDKKERRANLQRFRDQSVDVLICTDMAARGLDVEHVGRVINYFLPKEMANYLHRVGRTARAGREGTVINLVTKRDRRFIESLSAPKRRK